jgi:hypothetical protein
LSAVPRLAGALLLPAVFAALGAVWIAGAAEMSWWSGFAPGDGFLPMIYGLLLLALAAWVAVEEVAAGGEAPADPLGKPLLVLAATTVAVLGVEQIGFVPAIFLLLAFLFAVVERRAVLPALLVALAVAASLHLLFQTWLGIPLPAGPLGV